MYNLYVYVYMYGTPTDQSVTLLLPDANLRTQASHWANLLKGLKCLISQGSVWEYFHNRFLPLSSLI